jgi:hypothetical protein
LQMALFNVSHIISPEYTSGKRIMHCLGKPFLVHSLIS